MNENSFHLWSAITCAFTDWFFLTKMKIKVRKLLCGDLDIYKSRVLKYNDIPILSTIHDLFFEVLKNGKTVKIERYISSDVVEIYINGAILRPAAQPIIVYQLILESLGFGLYGCNVRDFHNTSHDSKYDQWRIEVPVKIDNIQSSISASLQRIKIETLIVTEEQMQKIHSGEEEFMELHKIPYEMLLLERL